MPPGSGFSWDASVYAVALRNEILNENVQPFPNAPFTVSTYRNVARSRHYGAEVGAAYQLPGGVFVRGDVRDHVTARLAYTYGKYELVHDSAYGNHHIPGAPRHYATTELKYEHPADARTFYAGLRWSR